MLKYLKNKRVLLVLVLLVAAFSRLWNLSGIPVSLFGDELDVGYHALSLLETGRDYSGNFLPLHLQSLAEWRTPIYLYSVIPTVAIWGISALGVRLPAALFGILGVWAFYLLIKELTKDEYLSLLSAFLLAISPWHIQYSRGAFEVTQLLLFLILGFLFFYKGLKDGKYMWLSATFFVLSPLIYSTAKLFVPLILVFLFFAYRKEIFSLSRKHLLWAVLALFIFGAPTAYSTFAGGGVQRFGYLSIISDPVVEPEVGELRKRVVKTRDEGVSRLTFLDRAVYNKYSHWTDTITDNYLQAFSTDFLFIIGDPNSRHSLPGMGQLYKIEIIALLVGASLFFTRKKDKRLKYLVLLWVLFGVLPSSLTRDGGNHATRLILVLPPLMLLTAWGIKEGSKLAKKKYRPYTILAYAGILLISFLFYQYNYRYQYPLESEGWWHAGWKEAVTYVKENEEDYERVFITMADEPAWIFFASWYEYPPEVWQKNYPLKKREVPGFGEVSYINNFYFGSPNGDGAKIYDLPGLITPKDLYLASAKEVPFNLAKNRRKVPAGLKLVKLVKYPSGAPAFYLFTKDEK